jgi:carboxylate-amine ligase
VTAVAIDLSAAALRARFDEAAPMTLGLEEEVMLVDAETLAAAPRAHEIIAELGDESRFKPELAACQVELVTTPCTTAGEAIAQLARGRRDLAEACAGRVRPISVGVHPFAPPLGEISPEDTYAHMTEYFGPIARLEQIAALQVHVALGSAERALAVYNALRSFLPDLAAIAANAPFFMGRDSELASVRPPIVQELKRQGVPPPLASWEEYADHLEWGARSGALPSPGQWWYELRPNVLYGTLEIRVPDAQATVEHGAAIAALGHSLVAWLAERADAGHLPAPAPSWRIAENGWSATRHGVEGFMADLETGAREPTRERLLDLITTLEPYAESLGCAAELAGARELVNVNGAMRQRTAAGPDGDAKAATQWLADVFVPDRAPEPRPAGEVPHGHG